MDADWAPSEEDEKSWNMSMELDDEKKKDNCDSPAVGSLFHLPSTIRRIIQIEPLNCRAVKCALDQGEVDGHPLLHFFLKTRNVDGVRLMLDNGVFLDDPVDLMISWNALFYMQEQSLAIIDLLIERNAPIYMDTHVWRMKAIASRWKNMERVVQMADKMERLIVDQKHNTLRQLHVLHFFPAVLNELIVLYLFYY